MRGSMKSNVLMLMASILGGSISPSKAQNNAAYALARAAFKSTGNKLNQRQRRKRNRQTNNFK